MYGSRELFHSNLIGWFFDMLPEAADATFRPLALPGLDSGRWVDRERGHLDLVFHWPDRAPLVIENKVFSLPNREQLDEYEAVASTWPQAPSLVLLSVSPPGFDPGRWHYLSYAEFAARIIDALPVTTSYEVETMQRYAALVMDLHDLISVVDVMSDSEPVWLPPSLLREISSSQMRAALHKARAHRVAHMLNAHLPELGQNAHGAISNATPLVDVFEEVELSDMTLQLGWQLQGDQFRRAVVYHDESIYGHNQESRKERESVSRRHPEFFMFPGALSQTQGGRKDFNHFAPNFVYRYVKTPGLTIGELKEAATLVHEDIVQLGSAVAAES
jgi:hypothetical protein